MSSDRLAVAFECTPVRELDVGGGDLSPAEAIVEAVADLDGVESSALSPIYESVDPDAVNTLVRHRPTDPEATVEICFTYHGWTVFVTGDGTIVIGDPGERSGPTQLF